MASNFPPGLKQAFLLFYFQGEKARGKELLLLVYSGFFPPSLVWEGRAKPGA